MDLEAILKQYFTGEADAEELAETLEEARDDEDSITHYQFKDMDTVFYVEPSHLIQLCNTVLALELEPDYLNDIAHILQNSEGFEWDDDRVTEISFFWLEPEDNYDLNLENTEKFKRWLTGQEPLPED